MYARILRRLAVLAMTCLVAAGATLVGGATPAAAAALRSSIRNSPRITSVNLGVIHFEDGRYGEGGTQLYDGLLEPGAVTDLRFHWTEASGFYLGYGWCAQIWRL